MQTLAGGLARFLIKLSRVIYRGANANVTITPTKNKVSAWSTPKIVQPYEALRIPKVRLLGELGKVSRLCVCEKLLCAAAESHLLLPVWAVYVRPVHD